jgi:mono/diheme cytochrome c family protein
MLKQTTRFTRAFYAGLLAGSAWLHGAEASERSDLQYQARQIIAHKCWKCHGSERDEGDLRLHTRQHILDSGTVDLAAPRSSTLLQRINLPEGHDKIMPSKSKPLSQNEIAILTAWLEGGLQWDGRGAFKEAPLAPRKVPAVINSEFSNTIDQHVDRYFKANEISWKPVVEDRVFLRRAYLDCIGLLPTEAEAAAFLADESPDKRQVLVATLLGRTESYQQHWLTFWNDLLRNDYTGTGFITGGRKQITKWLRNSLSTNKPYDVMVKELMSNDPESQGFIKGIRWRGTVSASQTPEMQAAQNSAQAFLGVNIKCASCHDAFTSNWSLQQAHEFASCFSEDGSIRIHRCDKDTGRTATPGFLYDGLGSIEPNAKLDDRLKALGEMLTHKENGRFSRTIVNRYWALLLGRGLVFHVDEMDTEPWSADVLDDLAYRFVENGYDLQWLIAEIMNSRAYQLPSVQSESRSELASSDYVFCGPIVRRLSAEQFADGFSQTVTPIYSVHKNGRIVRAGDKPRDPFQTALGRPNRENVTSTRSERGNLLESLELTNGTVLDSALKKAARQAHQQFGENSGNYIQQLFLRGLNRQPTEKERDLLVSVYEGNRDAVAYHDIIWIFINLPEFQTIF